MKIDIQKITNIIGLLSVFALLPCVSSLAEPGGPLPPPTKQDMETQEAMRDFIARHGNIEGPKPEWAALKPFPKDASIQEVGMESAEPQIPIRYMVTATGPDSFLYVLRNTSITDSRLYAIAVEGGEARILKWSFPPDWCLEVLPANGRISPLVLGMIGPGGSGSFMYPTISYLDKSKDALVTERVFETSGVLSFKYDSSKHALNVTTRDKDTEEYVFPVSTPRYGEVAWNDAAKPILTAEELARLNETMPKWMTDPLRWPTAEERAESSFPANRAAVSSSPRTVFRPAYVPLFQRESFIGMQRWVEYRGYNPATMQRADVVLLRYSWNNLAFQISRDAWKHVVMFRNWDAPSKGLDSSAIVQKALNTARDLLGTMQMGSFRVLESNSGAGWVCGLYRAASADPRYPSTKTVRVITNGIFFRYDVPTFEGPTYLWDEMHYPSLLLPQDDPQMKERHRGFDEILQSARNGSASRQDLLEMAFDANAYYAVRAGAYVAQDGIAMGEYLKRLPAKQDPVNPLTSVMNPVSLGATYSTLDWVHSESPVISLLESPHTHIRYRMAWAIGRSRNRPAPDSPILPRLLACAEKERISEVREMMIFALGRAGYEPARPFIEKEKENTTDDWFRSTCDLALKWMDNRDLPIEAVR